MRKRIAISVVNGASIATGKMFEYDVRKAVEELRSVEDGSTIYHSGNPQITAVVYTESPDEFIKNYIRPIPGVLDAEVMSIEADIAIDEAEKRRAEEIRRGEFFG